MYPFIPWELVVDPLGSMEHTLGTAVLASENHGLPTHYNAHSQQRSVWHPSEHYIPLFPCHISHAAPSPSTQLTGYFPLTCTPTECTLSNYSQQFTCLVTEHNSLGIFVTYFIAVSLESFKWTTSNFSASLMIQTLCCQRSVLPK